MTSSNYNVFINCPYDQTYKGLLDVILFVIVVSGFNPRLAKETSDSGENRIDKIIKLIQGSKYSIHDLSRMVSSKSGEIFRLNMPLELGIDYGCRKLLPKIYGDKKFLILDKEQYRFQKALSDLSGIDIKAHDDNGAKLMECIRDWFVETVGIRSIPSPDKMFSDYTDDFQPYLLEKAKDLGYTESNYFYKVTIVEYIDYVKSWKKDNTLYCKIVSFSNEDTTAPEKSHLLDA